ncbi:ATP synthase E chain-domain-containing protein, partial [Cantharellus anzutake]|uniref:ATP synthase E chain-domain-containing protein n=1 Tax=Cantharellus anzutake TaxID=1750568 RepID=UPI001903FF42
MASPTLTVARYTALIGGIFYGIAHRRTLQAKANEKAIEHELHRRETLLEQARKAWAEKSTSKNSDLITNPEDPKFDLEAFVAAY